MSGELICSICGRRVEPEGPGICQYVERRSGELVHGWVEFIEDWRGGETTWLHPRCFAEQNGVDALIAVVHQRDLLSRGVVPKLMMEIDPLRKPIGLAPLEKRSEVARGVARHQRQKKHPRNDGLK